MIPEGCLDMAAAIVWRRGMRRLDGEGARNEWIEENYGGYEEAIRAMTEERGDACFGSPWGELDYKGYYRFTRTESDPRALVHRTAYRCWHGPFTPGLVVHHLCGNRWCINPRHLVQWTSAANTQAGRTTIVTDPQAAAIIGKG